MAMISPTPIPNVTADSPRSENPFNSTSTNTTRMPIPSPTPIARTPKPSPAIMVSDTSQPAAAHSKTKPNRIGRSVLFTGSFFLKFA